MLPVPPDLQSGGLEYQESNSDSYRNSEANYNPLLPFVQILVVCRITDPYTPLRRRIADPPQQPTTTYPNGQKYNFFTIFILHTRIKFICFMCKNCKYQDTDIRMEANIYILYAQS